MLDTMFFGIFAMVMVGAGWTIWGYVMGKAPKLNIDVNALLFIFTGLAFAISTAAAFSMGVPQATLKGWLLGYVILVIGGFANYFQLEIMSRAMQRGPNGIIWTIAQSGFIFPFAMGVICFNVPVYIYRAAGFILIIISLIMFGLSGKNDSSGKWKFLAMQAFVVTGISQALSNLPSYFVEAEAITPMWRTSGAAAGMVLGVVLVKIAELPKMVKVIRQEIKRWEVWKMAMLAGLSNVVFSFLFLYPGMNTLEKLGAGAIAYPVMVCSCLAVFELFAIICLREERSPVQIAALILCLCGAVGICL